MFLRFIFFVFLFFAVFLDVIWVLHGFSFSGIFVAVLVNFGAAVLGFIILKRKRIDKSDSHRKESKRNVDVFAGISAVLLSLFFLFYAWSVISGRNLMAIENVRYSFYYDFTALLIGCCGVYAAAIFNLLVAVVFVVGGFKLVFKKMK